MSMSAFAFSQDDGFTFSFQGAPMDLCGSIYVEVPGFAFGPMADFVILPVAIDIGGGMRNYLGIGAQAGLYLVPQHGFAVVPTIAGTFVGRFGFIPSFPIDIDAKLGFMLGYNTVFYGASGIGVKLEDANMRIYAGVEFYANPYYNVFDYYSPELLVNGVLAVGYYFL